MLVWLQGKLAVWGTVIAGVLTAIAYAFLKGRSEGQAKATQQITQKINDRAQKVDREIQKVDNQPIDFGAAVSRLRDRGKK